MDQIELLKNKNRNLKKDIINNKNAIYINMSIIVGIVIASLGGGVILGLLLEKITKTLAISIAIGLLASIKPLRNIAICNRDIDDCNAQIVANKSGINNLEEKLKNKKQSEVNKTKSEKSSYSYNNSKYAKKTQEFNAYLNDLKDDGFFDYTDNSHKSR